MKINVRIVSNIEEMQRIEHRWNAFVSENGESPFLFSGFVNQLLKPNAYYLEPRILLFSIDNKIVGVVPVGLSSILSFRCGWFLLNKEFQPDLIFDPEYSEVLLRKTVTILFRDMGCHMVGFSLPENSQHLPLLKQICREMGGSFSFSPQMGRAITNVTGSWFQFEKNNRRLRRDIERTERRMKEMGSLNIRFFGKSDNSEKVFERIMEVEQASWKSLNHQLPQGYPIDPSLLFIFNGCVQTSLMDPLFDWGVAFLELNGNAIAYCLFLEYKGHAYVCKTSFDNRYRKQSPGVYINHVVVRELMNRPNVKVIDFMTNLPFSHKWASEVVPVNRFLMMRKGMGPLYMLGNALINRIPKVRRFLSKTHSVTV